MSRAGGDVDTVDGVLVALADPRRRQLLELLSAGGAATATTLAESLPVSRQAVVKHLAVLDEAGLVASHRVGREVRYAVQSAALDTTARWMTSLTAEWDRRLATIKRIAEAVERDGQSSPAPSRPGVPARPWVPTARFTDHRAVSQTYRKRVQSCIR